MKQRGLLKVNDTGTIEGSGTIINAYDDAAASVFSVDGDGDVYAKREFVTGDNPYNDGYFGTKIEEKGCISVRRNSTTDPTFQSYAAAGTTPVTTINCLGHYVSDGDVTCDTLNETSDQRFKKNITDANPQLADVTALGEKLCNWDWTDDAPITRKDTRSLGVIAQEVEALGLPGIAFMKQSKMKTVRIFKLKSVLKR